MRQIGIAAKTGATSTEGSSNCNAKQNPAMKTATDTCATS